MPFALLGPAPVVAIIGHIIMATNGGIPVLPQDLNQFVPVAVLDNDAKTLHVVVKQMAWAKALGVNGSPMAGVN